MAELNAAMSCMKALWVRQRRHAVGKVDVEKLKQRFLKARAAWRAAQKRQREKRKKQEAARLRRIGGVVLAMVEAGQYPREELLADLDKFLSDAGDRKLFGLAPVEDRPVAVLVKAGRKGGHMTKAELIDQVVRQAGGGLNKKDTAALLDAAFGVVGKAIRDRKRFSYPGFGTFMLRERAARGGRNPQTGEAIKIEASQTVAFKPAPALKESL